MFTEEFIILQSNKTVLSGVLKKFNWHKYFQIPLVVSAAEDSALPG